jgi:cysteine desulfurase
MRCIYLDYHSTTPCDSRVVQAMLPYFTEHCGNPSNTHNEFGRTAAIAVAVAREKVAALIGASPRDVIFTGGATESNNLAIFGLTRFGRHVRRRVITTAIEHKSVLGPFTELERRGFETVILPVDHQGMVRLDVAEKEINECTLLVSVHLANNEVGTIQPVSEVARLAHAKGALVHCDAAQAVGKINVDVDQLAIDLLSTSAHKLYGPKGVGALYVRRGVRLTPLLMGGGQEWSLRSGTSNVPGIVGFGEACALCESSLVEEDIRVSALRDRLEHILLSQVPGLRRNGSLSSRLPGNSSLTFPGIDAEALIANMPHLAVSTGSACNAGAPEPSYVLLGIGLSREEAYSTIRVGLGRFTTLSEVELAAATIIEAYARIRALSPLTG